MPIAPQDQNPIFLTPDEIKTKFEELGMLAFLRETCKPHKIHRSTKCLADRKYTAEHGENFIRNSDGNSQAILYWCRTPEGGEDYRVAQFTTPDGKFYSTDTIKHPSKFSE